MSHGLAGFERMLWARLLTHVVGLVLMAEPGLSGNHASPSRDS
jgi:hypothetical protein